MRAAHGVSKVRAAERALMAQLPPGALMQRAAAGLASVCAGLVGRVNGTRVVVLAGSGDNGGDALHAAARLARRGAAVLAVTAGSRVHEEGSAALRAVGGRLAGPDDSGVADAITAADLIIDGLLGIGGRGGLREPQASLAGLAACSMATVVATDLPSGVDADTGVVEGAAVHADVTVTFGTYKPGLLVDPGATYAGVVELIDIGLGPHLASPDLQSLQAADVGALLPQPPPDSDKYRRGVAGIVAGSDRFTGAAALAVGGALRGGAGMVRLVSAQPAVDIVRQLWPEALITITGGKLAAGEDVQAAGRVQAWVAGPGMGTGDEARERLATVLATDLPVLVDADGLTLLAADRGLLSREAPTLLTPHAGELGRLLGADPRDVEARRLEHTQRAADELGATVLLKGSTTVIASPRRPGARPRTGDLPQEGPPVFANASGTSWLASAGTGDVLSGLAGSLLAQGLEAADAAAAAAYLHGLAARLAASGTAAAPEAAAMGPWRASRLDRGAPAGGDAADAPIVAGDVVVALPAAIRFARGRPA
ncbi:MAG TPA: NAD(P)H-hydrate dehydratase [Streptosporangiaceae bacterium]|nr:NAD(P)H-hydrate dehydratase [Streptosporangiaceae bacterium]